MHRRDLLEVLGAAVAVPMLRPLSPAARLTAAREIHRRAGTGTGPRALDPHQYELTTAIAERILPATDTPGATAAGVPDFVDLILAEWHTPEERAGFLKGLDAIDALRGPVDGGFLALSPAEQDTLLLRLDGVYGDPGTPEAAFTRLKQLTIYGYLTSEAVMEPVLHYQVIPGRYDGCLPRPTSPG